MDNRFSPTLKDDSGSQGQYREERRSERRRGEMTLTVEHSEMTAKMVEH